MKWQDHKSQSHYQVDLGIPNDSGGPLFDDFFPVPKVPPILGSPRIDPGGPPNMIPKALTRREQAIKAKEGLRALYAERRRRRERGGD